MAQDIYGSLGARAGAVRAVQRDTAFELGAQADAPATRDDAEEALWRLGAATSHLAADGRLDPGAADQLLQRLEHAWSSLRAGESLSMHDVAVLRRLDQLHGPPLSADQRLEDAQRHLAAAKIQLGLAALRHRNGGDPGAHAAALARCEEASRAVLRAQTDQGSEGLRRCPDCGQYAGDDHQCPLPPGLPASDYGSLKGDDRTKEMIADLRTAVAAIVQSGQLQRWLDVMASNGLNRWSLNNRILAVTQLAMRGDTLEQVHLMGFRQWEKYNRRVRKGEKAVWILAPITRKIRDTDEHGTTSEKVIVRGFKAVPVFNVTQTDGQPLPELPLAPPAGDATPGTLEGLRKRVGRAGYRYEEAVIPGCQPETGQGVLGYTTPGDRRIVVDQRLSPAQKASTIAHELGHIHCGHVDGDYTDYQRHRGRMETEAEMTAYMVNRSRGMSRTDANSFTPGYIASWSKGDPAVITGAMDRSVKAFNTIMEGDWP